VDLSALSIVSGKTCWVVYVDALLLNIGGNLHDAVSIAAKVRAGTGKFHRGQEAGDGALACVSWKA
jgi:exosome complex component RRP42